MILTCRVVCDTCRVVCERLASDASGRLLEGIGGGGGGCAGTGVVTCHVG